MEIWGVFTLVGLGAYILLAIVAGKILGFNQLPGPDLREPLPVVMPAEAYDSDPVIPRDPDSLRRPAGSGSGSGKLTA